MHHKLFWLVQSIFAIQQNHEVRILHYNLVRISGTGGNIKYLYAGKLVNWLSKYMGLEENEVEDDGEDEESDDDV